MAFLPPVRAVGPDQDRMIETAGGAGITGSEARGLVQLALPRQMTMADFKHAGRQGKLKPELADLWDKYGHML